MKRSQVEQPGNLVTFIMKFVLPSFLFNDTPSHLYKRAYPFIGWSVSLSARPSNRPSVRLTV